MLYPVCGDYAKATPKELFVIYFPVFCCSSKHCAVNRSPWNKGGRSCLWDESEGEQRRACSTCSINGPSLLPHVGSPALLLLRTEEAKRLILSERELCLRIPWVDSIAMACFQESSSSSLSATRWIPTTDGRGHHHSGSDRGSQLMLRVCLCGGRVGDASGWPSQEGPSRSPLRSLFWETSRCDFWMKQTRV